MIRVRLVCQLIIHSIAGTYKNRHVISMDEKTGIQALYRKEAPMRKGRIKRQESEYKRNGTTTLIGALMVSNGEVIHAHLGPTRKEEDFLRSCQQVVASFSKEDEIIILLDQLNTHKSASLVEWIALETGFEGELGIKGKKGILKNQQSRMAFLEKENHRIRFVFLPKHCSWLNPIENWFGKLQRHVITGSVFTSVQNLEDEIREYIQYYNRCMLKPLKWKFKGFAKNKILEGCVMVKT